MLQCCELPADVLAAIQSILGLLCYRIHLHPLAGYPGPFFARLTEWDIVHETSTGDRHLNQLKRHQKYGKCSFAVLLSCAVEAEERRGPVVRIGPNTLSFNTIGAVKEIYTNRAGNVKKSPWYTVIEASSGAARSLHAETDRDIHASHRRIMEHAFTNKSLRTMVSLIARNVRTFCDLVEKQIKEDEQWSEPFNMSQWATYLNYDVMGDLVFGRRFDCMTSEAHRFVPKLLMNSTSFIYTVSLDGLSALDHHARYKQV